nr:hypothetical protein SBE_002649 [Streptomyces sp. SBE_14.2]
MSTFTPREVAYDRYRAAVNSSRSVLGRHADDVRTDRARLLHRAAHSIAAALDGPARVHLPEPDDDALHLRECRPVRPVLVPTPNYRCFSTSFGRFLAWDGRVRRPRGAVRRGSVTGASIRSSVPACSPS